MIHCRLATLAGRGWGNLITLTVTIIVHTRHPEPLVTTPGQQHQRGVARPSLLSNFVFWYAVTAHLAARLLRRTVGYKAVGIGIGIV